MWYYRRLPAPNDRLVVMHTRPEHAAQLEDLQRVCFPTLDRSERFQAAHYRRHIELFPDGQFVVLDVLDGDRVVGATTTLRLHFDFDHIDHTFADIIQGGWLTSHEPDGDWLYGADIGVHPDFRRRGLATLLYEERQGLCRRLGLTGHVEGAMPKGYHRHREAMAIEAYVSRVVRGEIDDPTLSVQLHRGYHVYGLIPDYLEDPSCANYGVFVVWRNSDCR